MPLPFASLAEFRDRFDIATADGATIPVYEVGGARGIAGAAGGARQWAGGRIL